MDHEFHSKIAGVTYNCPRTGMPRQEIIRKFLRRGTVLTPLAEPDNPHGDTAVALWLRHDGTDYHVGYVRHEPSDEVFAALQQGKDVSVLVTEVTGGSGSKSNVGANILIGWNDRPGRSAHVSAPVEVVGTRPGFIRQNWIALLFVAVALSCLVCGVLGRLM